MPRRSSADDDWDDDWDDDEDTLDDYGADYEREDDEDEPTVPCPYCRREIHEDASQCPYCEQYISREDAPRQPKPWWIVLGVVVCLYAMLRWLWWPGGE